MTRSRATLITLLCEDQRHEVRPEEQAILQPIRMQLTAHLDQMSLDEIISRIEQLPVARQRQLLALLTERWGI